MKDQTEFSVGTGPQMNLDFSNPIVALTFLLSFFPKALGLVFFGRQEPSDALASEQYPPPIMSDQKEAVQHTTMSPAIR